MLYPVAVAGAKFLGLLAKENSYLAIVLDDAPSDHVVRVTVADTDPVSFILRQDAIFHKSIGDAPAEENPLAVSPG